MDIILYRFIEQELLKRKGLNFVDTKLFANSQCERSKLIGSTIKVFQRRYWETKSRRCGTKESLLLSKLTTKVNFLIRIAALEISFAERGHVVKMSLLGKERFEEGQFTEAMNSLFSEKLDFVLRKIILSETPNEYILRLLEELDALLNLFKKYEAGNK